MNDHITIKFCLYDLNVYQYSSFKYIINIYDFNVITIIPWRSSLWEYTMLGYSHKYNDELRSIIEFLAFRRVILYVIKEKLVRKD